jgi:hypothetical protein
MKPPWEEMPERYPRKNEGTPHMTPQTRRELLMMISKVGGGLAMHQAMTALGHAAETQFAGAPNLTGARPIKRLHQRALQA